MGAVRRFAGPRETGALSPFSLTLRGDMPILSEPGDGTPAARTGTEAMIHVTRLNGAPFAINADLIERVDITPDTVISLVDGKKHLVAETAQEIADKVVAF